MKSRIFYCSLCVAFSLAVAPVQADDPEVKQDDLVVLEGKGHDIAMSNEQPPAFPSEKELQEIQPAAGKEESLFEKLF